MKKATVMHFGSVSSFREGEPALSSCGSYVDLDEHPGTLWREGCYDAFEGIAGARPALREVLDQVLTVGPAACTVLIQGETGTGKELIARAIRMESERRTRPFVKLNCAAIPAELSKANSSAMREVLSPVL
jgi:transcriptional regulator with AAA-type ATPase domain